MSNCLLSFEPFEWKFHTENTPAKIYMAKTIVKKDWFFFMTETSLCGGELDVNAHASSNHTFCIDAATVIIYNGFGLCKSETISANTV